MMRFIDIESVMYLIKLRNSGCPSRYFSTVSRFPAVTHRFRYGTFGWKPNHKHDIINIEININISSSELTLLRSADPEKPKTIVISNRNRSFEIEYQDGIKGASLYVEERTIVMGDAPVLSGKPVKYEDLELDSRVDEQPGRWIRPNPFSTDYETY